MANKTKKKQNNNKGMLVGIAAGSLVLVGALAGFLIYLQQPRQAEPEPVVETIATTERPTEPVEEFDPSSVVAGPVNGEQGLVRTLMDNYNADTRGWIYIPDTDVDYPIVQSDDNAYYLDRGFDHEEFRAGAIFMDFRDDFGFNEDLQSENIILYGHNMANNSMFGSLRRYRQDLDFYKESPFIEVDSLFHHYTYVIFALPITDGSSGATWRYWDLEELNTKEEFDAYVETARQKSLVDIPVDAKFGDKILTLSTCYSDEDDSRFLVIARRVRPDETAESFQKLFAQEDQGEE